MGKSVFCHFMQGKTQLFNVHLKKKTKTKTKQKKHTHTLFDVRNAGITESEKVEIPLSCISLAPKTPLYQKRKKKKRKRKSD